MSEQLDAAYAAFAHFMGAIRLDPETMNKLQHTFLCGYMAGLQAQTNPQPPAGMPPATHHHIDARRHRWQRN